VAVSNSVCPKTAVGADVPSVVVVFAPGAGAGELFNSTPTVLEEVLVATRSTRPSPFRSAAATPKGSLPPVRRSSRISDWKVPSPLPANTERLPEGAPS